MASSFDQVSGGSGGFGAGFMMRARTALCAAVMPTIRPVSPLIAAPVPDAPPEPLMAAEMLRSRPKQV